jgi:tetratricopeptide (TPR) repeat protein
MRPVNYRYSFEYNLGQPVRDEMTALKSLTFTVPIRCSRSNGRATVSDSIARVEFRIQSGSPSFTRIHGKIRQLTEGAIGLEIAMRAARTVKFIAVQLICLFMFVPLTAFATSLDEATALDRQVIQFYEQGRYSEAIPLAQRSIAIHEKFLGPNHRDVATVLNNLALLYKELGCYADADPLLKRSLTILKRALGPDHPDVATLLNNLAELYQSQGRYAEAEPLFKRALEILDKNSGPNDSNFMTALNNLALISDLQGRYAGAEPLYKRSLAIREKVLGPDHRDVGNR